MNNPEKNQNTLTLGHKRYGKTLCLTDISDVLFTGGFRSGKTESAMNYVSEVAKVNECRIVILSTKPDWRKLGKYISSKKYTCNPLEERKINIFKAINGVELQDMSFVISELWCLYNHLPMSCAGIMAKAIYAAYKDAGVPYAWEYFGFEQAFREKSGEFPKSDLAEKVLGVKGISTYAYRKMREAYPYISSLTIASLTREVESKFNKKKKAYYTGQEIVLSYRFNLPIPIKKKQFRIEEILHSDGEQNGTHQYILCATLFSIAGAKEMNRSTEVRLKMLVKHRNQISFLRECNQLSQYRIENGSRVLCSDGSEDFEPRFQLTESKIAYDERNRKFYLNLGYSFTKKDNDLNKDRWRL